MKPKKQSTDSFDYYYPKKPIGTKCARAPNSSTRINKGQNLFCQKPKTSGRNLSTTKPSYVQNTTSTQKDSLSYTLKRSDSDRRPFQPKLLKKNESASLEKATTKKITFSESKILRVNQNRKEQPSFDKKNNRHTSNFSVGGKYNEYFNTTNPVPASNRKTFRCNRAARKKQAHRKAHSEDIYGQRKNGSFHSNLDKYFEQKIGAEIFEDITLRSSEIFGANQQKVQQIEQQASRDKNFLKSIKGQFKNNKERWDSKYSSAANLHNFRTSPTHENPTVWKQREHSYKLELEINEIILKNFQVKTQKLATDPLQDPHSKFEPNQNKNPKKKLVDIILKNPKLFNTKRFASLRKQSLNSTVTQESKNCRSVLSVNSNTKSLAGQHQRGLTAGVDCKIFLEQAFCDFFQ